MSSEREKRSYKIGEVCKLANVQPYVLRYWETEFPPLSPGKTGGGQRTYSQSEIDIILRIKELLYGEGFTIAGAKKKLEGELASGRLPTAEQGDVPNPNAALASSPRVVAGASGRDALSSIKKELRDLIDRLGE